MHLVVDKSLAEDLSQRGWHPGEMSTFWVLARGLHAVTGDKGALAVQHHQGGDASHLPDTSQDDAAK